MKNPFLDYGKIVKGERFIGRKKEIAVIRNRVLHTSFGNIAIQGIPRIGKSSLAWNALISDKDRIETESNIFIIRINVSSLNSSTDFFMKLLKELSKRIKKNSEINNKIIFNQQYDEIISAKSTVDKLDLIENYFQILREFNFRAVYILDEFDAVRNYLNVGDFQFLRELTYNPEIEICIVSISRRSIKEIEPEEGNLSNFYQTFNDLHLGMYCIEDMNEYWTRFFPKDVALTIEDIDNITSFAGQHPFLLDLFNFHLFNYYSDNLSNAILTTKKNIKVTLNNNYNTIFDLLNEEGLSSKLIQTVIGPNIDLKSEDVEKLEKLDLIKKSTSKYVDINGIQIEGFETFSDDFEQYLRMKNREVSIWDLWSETEIKLRILIHDWLTNKFGENWVIGYKKYSEKNKKYIESLVLIQDKEKKSFPDTYSLNLLDFTYPSDLFDRFISKDWGWFGKIFGGQKNDWKLKFDFLAKIRNPLAHNKSNLLKDFEKDDAAGFCKEIIQKIDNWYNISISYD